jgi:hypothetical protein
MRQRLCGIAMASASVVALLVSDVSAQQSGKADFEAAPVTNPADIVPKGLLEGSGYRVQGKALGDGMLYTYTLWTPQETFRPGSTDMLVQRIAEARAINELSKMQQDPLFLEGVGETVESSVDTVKSAVTAPLKTVRQVPMGLAKFAGSVGARVSEGKVTGESGGPLAAKTKRQLASQLGVDPYSGNGLLQQMLNDVARNKNLGKLTASLSTMAAGGATQTVLSVVSLSTKARSVLYDRTAPELQESARTMLRELGCNESQASRFLSNERFNVTRRYAIASAMSSLKSVKGIQGYIGRVLDASGPEMALFYQRQIELAEAYNSNVRQLARVEFVTGTPLYTDVEGKKIIFAPIDILYWNSDLSLRVNAFKSMGPKAAIELWITGQATDAAKSQLSKSGVTVKEKCLSDLSR